MFDPKSIYRQLNIREIIGDAPLGFELHQKDWPASELAFIRLYTEDGRNGWVLIAPGSTAESVTESLHGVVTRLTKKAETPGGDPRGL